MPFNAPLFLFLLLPAALITHFSVQDRWRNAVLLAVSILFYAFVEPRFVFVVLLSSLLDVLLGRLIGTSRRAGPRRLCLALGVAGNLAVLVTAKYAGFAMSNLNGLLELFGLSAGSVDFILPVGLSFITFEKISYLVDVYRGICPPARSLRDYLLFVFLFPKLMAGPIIKYHDIAQQLAAPRWSAERRAEGLARFILGLSKKILIADSVGEAADQIFSIPVENLTFVTAWLGALCFSMQIFFDFSGYSDMAIGLARAFGFDIQENFRQPYRSRNFTDFWRRWHISLSSWIRDYLYVPLGGSRRSESRTYLNLVTCFVASGLWHGASWTFVVWGLYHGAFIVIHRIGTKLGWTSWPQPLATAVTFLLIVLGWVLFRSTDLGHGIAMMRAMFDPTTGLSPSPRLLVSRDVYVFLAIALFVSFMPQDPFLRLAALAGMLRPSFAVLKGGSVLLLLVLCAGRAVTATFHPFLYSRF